MRRITALALAGLLWTSAAVLAADDRTPQGTGLKHFNEVDSGVFKGSKPRSDADFKYLQSLHIKTVVDLEFLPVPGDKEKKKARKYGIEILSVKLNASPLSPSREHIEQALSMIRDRRCQPVYFHCALGRDRTALLATLYKMYFMGMSPEAGERYLHASGYKDGWVRSGLTRYLEKHPTPPTAFRSAVSSESCDRE